MEMLQGRWLGWLAVTGLLGLGHVQGVQAHGTTFGPLPPPPLPHEWHPPHPPLSSIAVNFPPLVLGSPYYPALAYHPGWAPRPYVRHEHYHYHGQSHGHHAHKHHWHGHGHHGHHHDDD